MVVYFSMILGMDMWCNPCDYRPDEQQLVKLFLVPVVIDFLRSHARF
jgi:hypothetical protein